MNLIKTIFLGAALAASQSLMSQSIIAGWSFPTGTSIDSIADQGIAQNASKTIKAMGTTVIDFSKNGYTTKSAQATAWDNGNGTKYWIIDVNTMGYDNLHLSSRQQSGGANAGPRDFKLQYTIDMGISWTDIAGGNIITANDYTTAFVDSISLPLGCNNQSALAIRWLMTSDTSSVGTIVTSAGVSKIDDIFIYGSVINTNVKENNSANINLYPNPASNQINITSCDVFNKIQIMNNLGETIYSGNYKNNIDVSNLTNGLYIIQLMNNNLIVGRQKFIKR